MIRVFADSYYFLALLNPNDEAHGLATEFTSEFSGRIVTTDWVLTELADGLSSPPARQIVIPFIEHVRTDSGMRVFAATRSLLYRGWSLFRQRQDKEWSLTDCISFVVMKECRLKDALTGDRHYEQAGFRAILRH